VAALKRRRAGASEKATCQAIAATSISVPQRTPSAPTVIATASACEAPTPDATSAGAVRAGFEWLRRQARSAAPPLCAGAQEEERERE
jgi:hypothetical protein